MPVAEKGGLERLVDRGVLDPQTRRGLANIFNIGETLDVIAGELCNLLEERDRRKGKSDNPPEIPETEHCSNMIETTKQEIDNALLRPGEYRYVGGKYFIRRGMLDGYDATRDSR